MRPVLLAALVDVFFHFRFVLPAAWYHRVRYDDRHDDPEPPESSLTVFVPAYNEEACLGRTIDSLVAARYPGEKEVVVVDVDPSSSNGVARGPPRRTSVSRHPSVPRSRSKYERGS